MLSHFVRRYAFAVLSTAILFLWIPAVSAQIAAGGVTGTATDGKGAVVVDAHITLTSIATGLKQTSLTNHSGSYTFNNLAPGTYRLEATAPGFATYVQEDVQVHVQQIVTEDIALSLGNVTDKVVVTSAIPLLQAQSGAVAQTIETQTVNDLPLVNRNWVSLAQLSAGVSTAPPNSPSTDSGTSGSAYFSVNGVNLWQNDIRLNGIDDNIEVYGGSAIGTQAAITPPPDAIQEFTLQSGNYNAEFGHSTGAVVNAVIKSGTGHFHGNLWEYMRNDAFNANDYFSKRNKVAKAEYRQNQFGGTFGGPILRDRLFFFADYQGERVVIPNQHTSTVPTASMQSSGFTNLQDLISYNSGTATDKLGRKFSHGTILDPATTRAVAAGAIDPISGLTNTTSSTIYVRDPFYSGTLAGTTDFTGHTSELNMIPEARMDSNALTLLKLYPAANEAGLANNYFINPKETMKDNQYDIRIDANLNAHNQLFGVFDRSLMTNSIPAALPGLAVGQSGARDDSFPAYAISVGYTHIFDATMINELHFGMTHSDKNQLSWFGNQMGIPEKYGIAGIPQLAQNGGLPAIGMNGLTGLGVATYSPTVQAVYDIEIVDNVTKSVGNHMLKAGYQFDYLRGNIAQPPYGRGYFGFTGAYSDIPNANSNLLGVADFLLTPTASNVGGVDYLGGPQNYSGSNFTTNNDRRYYNGAYFQDDWKATPRLTLNLGARWDYFTPYQEVNGRQANVILNGGNGAGGTMYMPKQACKIARSSTFDALLSSSGITLSCVDNASLGEAQKLNFAPRVGFAYRALNNVAIRGGYGIAYGALGNIGFGGNLGNAYPFLYTISNSSSSSQVPLLLPDGTTRATLESTFSNVNLSDPTLVKGSGLSLYGREWNIHTPYIQTYNLTAQYQFTRRDSIQAGFVGTVGRHLDDLTQHNSIAEILPPGLNQTSYLPLPKFAANSTYERFNGVSSYNSLQTTYQHDVTQSMSMLINYTFGKCLTNQRTQSSQAPGYRAQWLPGFGIGPDYSLCDSDTRHIVHMSGSNALPFGRNQPFLSHVSPAVDNVVGGWKVNYILTYQSGQPFSVGCPVSTTTGLGCYAFTVPGQSVYSAARNSAHWLNADAFSQPAVATTIGQTDVTPLGSNGQQARGPGFTNFDSSVFKNFSLPKSLNLQFRAEAFNTFNNAHLGQPGSLNFTVPSTFAKITSLRGGASNAPRRLQFALKLDF